MKCIVIYFSQTGNTEKIATAIRAGVENAAGHCDIVKMKDANPQELYHYDLIGLGSPVFSCEPINVKNFINNMRSVGGKHIFIFCTHGTHPERYFPSIAPKLKRKGLIVIGMRDWYGSVFIPEMPKPYFTDGHPDKIDLKEAKNFGKEMVKNSWKIHAGQSALIPSNPPRPPRWPKVIGGVDSSKKENQFKQLVKYRKELCRYPKCRLCIDNCPMNGIDLSVNPPVFAKPCENCTFCCKICPTGAIDISDYLAVWRPKVEKTTRGGFEAEPLPEAEKSGHFRRLVPPEKIGYDTPLYQVYYKQPQWIIGKGLISPNNK
jgi:flavodoxin/NAD-dependent dihydropyrimidine dehydrogenase PreA subunit